MATGLRMERPAICFGATMLRQPAMTLATLFCGRWRVAARVLPMPGLAAVQPRARHPLMARNGRFMWSVGRLAIRVRKVHRASKVHRAIPARQVQLGRRGRKARWARRGHRVRLAQPARRSTHGLPMLTAPMALPISPQAQAAPGPISASRITRRAPPKAPIPLITHGQKFRAKQAFPERPEPTASPLTLGLPMPTAPMASPISRRARRGAVPILASQRTRPAPPKAPIRLTISGPKYRGRRVSRAIRGYRGRRAFRVSKALTVLPVMTGSWSSGFSFAPPASPPRPPATAFRLDGQMIRQRATNSYGPPQQGRNWTGRL